MELVCGVFSFTFSAANTHLCSLKDKWPKVKSVFYLRLLYEKWPLCSTQKCLLASLWLKKLGWLENIWKHSYFMENLIGPQNLSQNSVQTCLGEDSLNNVVFCFGPQLSSAWPKSWRSFKANHSLLCLWLQSIWYWLLLFTLELLFGFNSGILLHFGWKQKKVKSQGRVRAHRCPVVQCPYLIIWMMQISSLTMHI